MPNCKRVVFAAFAALIQASAFAATRYVSTVGSDTLGDGSLASPYATIQKAINESAPSGDVVELADGTYLGFGNVAVNFAGKSIVVRSTSGTPQACIVDGAGATTGFYFISFEPVATTIEGISFQNCIQQGPLDAEGRGGAIVIENASPTFRNCIFTNNSAIGGLGGFLLLFPTSGLGGAVYAINSGSTFENCSFVGNSAIGGDSFVPGYAGIGGGGAVAGQNANLRFVGCAFGSNTTTGGNDGFLPPAARGGGVYIENGSAILEGCSFTQNVSGTGGGVYVFNGALETVNSIYVKNLASEHGAGMAVNSAELKITNCSIASNTATQNGGGVHIDGGFGPNRIDNSIVWDNSVNGTGSGFHSTGGAPAADISYSVVQGSGGSASWSLGGANDAGANMDTPPGFVRNPGTSGPNDLGDLRLVSASVCVDSGSNASVPLTITQDLDGEDRIFNGTVDRGAYEFHVTPAQLISDLKSSVDALVAGGAQLPAQGRALKATLNVALAAVNRNQNEVAILALNAFKLQCNALVFARRLTRAQADALIADANQIIGLLS